MRLDVPSELMTWSGSIYHAIASSNGSTDNDTKEIEDTAVCMAYEQRGTLILSIQNEIFNNEFLNRIQ